MHIAKTGGSSLNKFFSRYYPAEHFAEHYEGKLLQSGGAEINTQFYYISGHISLQKVNAILQKHNYIKITLFRNPIDQLTSHINWVASVSQDENSRFFLSHPPNIQQLSKQLRRLDYSNPICIDSFFKDIREPGKYLFDNCQTRYLLPKVSIPALDYSHLQEAIATLNQFHRVSTLDRIEDFKRSIISDYFQYQDYEEQIDFANKNPIRFITAAHVQKSEILTNFIQYDRVIYDIVKSLGERLA